MKRKLLLPIIFSQALIPNVYAATEVDSAVSEPVIQDQYEGLDRYDKLLQSLCDNEKIADLENVKNESNRIWKLIIETIKSTRIKRGQNLDFSPISNTVVGLNNESISENSFSDRYSGIDKWNINLSITPYTSQWLDIGVAGNREVTFIQQFDSKCKSLARSGYDPVTKIPTSADRALKNLKPGDFVAFSAPLTLSVGKNISRFFDVANLPNLLQAGFSADLRVFVTGEFNIHIFRMDNNYVRVRFFDSKGMGTRASGGLKVFGFKVLGKELLSINPIEFTFGKSQSDIFSADYVFNLNDPTAKDLYDKLMSQKLSITDSLFRSNLNPLISNSDLEKHAFSDLKDIDEASLEDSQKPADTRRVLRLSKGINHTKSSSFAIGANFFKLLKAKAETTKTNSNISIYNVVNENTKYNINTITDQSNYRFFELWGQQDTHSTALLTVTDESFTPQSTKGLQTFRLKEELTFTKDEFQSLKRRLSRTLPSKISEKLQLPDESLFNVPVAIVRIEQSLFINSHYLEQQRLFTVDNVETALAEVMRHWGRFSSAPVNSGTHGPHDTVDPRAKLKSEADWKGRNGVDVSALYMAAFSRDIGIIKTGITNMFNKTLSMSERINSYEDLRKNGLFNEIGSALILRMIPSEMLDDAVVYKLSITVRGVDSLTEYPKGADNTATNIFLQVLRDNTFMVDRSYNLRYYLSEKGIPFSLAEVIDRSK